MSYELPDFPLGIVYRTNTSRGVINYTDYESKEALMEYLNKFNSEPDVVITVYKMSTEINPATKQEQVVCRYHDVPKTIG